MLKKRWFRGLLIGIAAVALCVCVWCIIYIVQFFRGDKLDGELAALAMTTAAPAPSPTAEAGGETPAVEPGLQTPAPEGYTGFTVDFTRLKEVNPEIYAWIYVPGTVINYPVVQSAKDDLFYIDHSSSGDYFTGGSIFSQKSYNGLGFDEPMTVLYGHNLRSGKMFRTLNDFVDEAFYNEHTEIYILTENYAYRYEVFAAYVHNAEHLLANHDFTDPEEFELYFKGVLFSADRDYSHFTEEYMPNAGQSVITLSTCFAKNNKYRYLVQGVLTDTYALNAGKDVAK